MKIFHQVSEFDSFCRPAVSVGVFDGVHAGHQAIIESLIISARQRNCQSVVVTFDPHPRLVLDEKGRIHLLQTLDEKLNRFEVSGVDAAVVVPFNKDFSSLSPEKFIREILVTSLHAGHVVTGYDHFFGQHRQGNFHLLSVMGKELGFSVEEVPPVLINGMPVSSSEIRKILLEGNLKLAGTMLGYHYTIKGNVLKGNKIGRNIGYPTANLKPESVNKLIPAQGVYASLVKVRGSVYKGMTNIGFRPTVDAENMTIEVNIFDFDSDIYGETIELSFVDRIRDEKKFMSLGALQEQLAQDKIRAINLLSQGQNI